MSYDSNIAWDRVDQELVDYNQRQYDKKYRSTDFVISCLKRQILEKDNYRVLDMGCGAGASLSHIARNFNNCSFTGVDLNHYFINIARLKHKNLELSNTSFEHNSFESIVPGEYDIIGSTQFLEVLDLDKAKQFIQKMFQAANKGVYIHALFSERMLDYEINIHDYKYEKVVPYNIYSIEKINKTAQMYGFRMVQKSEFLIDIDLPDIHHGRGTYTVPRLNGDRMQFSDVLYLPWYFLYFEKE